MGGGRRAHQQARQPRRRRRGQGQQVFADGGRTPAHPNVEPRDQIRPAKIYPIGLDEIANLARYETIWKQAFQLR